MTADWRKARIAKNESRFRDINERLEDGLRHVRHSPELQQFICECGLRECEQLVPLTFDEYEAVRRDSRRFAIAPGHAMPDTERVVHRTDRYEVVEKFDPGSVERTDAADPRSAGDRGRRSPDAAP